MADTNALFAAILADRRDDALRLAYPDAIDATDIEHEQRQRNRLPSDRFGGLNGGRLGDMVTRRLVFHNVLYVTQS